MKNYFLGGLLALGMFIPLFADAISPDAWVLGSSVPSSDWISNTAGGCSAVLDRESCDYTGSPLSLRLGYEYEFGDEFWAGEQDRRFKNHCARFQEQGNYNTGDGRNGLNPNFNRTSQLINNGYRINKNTSMVILKADSIYQINAVPSVRSSNNLFIKYVVEYANDEAANTRYQHTECYPYEISRCGDGKVDKTWFKKGEDDWNDRHNHAEECDLGEDNGKPGSSCTIDCKKVEVKDPKCSSEYNAQTKYTETSAEWLKRTDKLCEEGDVDTFKSTRNEGQPRSFEWICKNSEGTTTQYVCNAKQEWCGDGVYNKDHEQCDPKDSKHTNYEDGTHKTCNEKCELVDDDAVCSSQYNGKNVYTSSSTHYLNGTASENLCNVGSLKQGTFGFNFVPGFPVYFQGNPYGPLQYKWLCENGKKTSSDCTLNQYRCGDGHTNTDKNPLSFIDGKAHYEACDPKDPNVDGKCNNDCTYAMAECGPANSSTAVYNPNYPTSRIKENELCKTGKLKEGSLSGPDSNGNYKWECINGAKEVSCGAKDLRCGDGKYQSNYEQCDPTDPNKTNWEDGTWKTCNSNCTLTGVVRNRPVCNSYFNGVHKYTQFDSTPWVKESDYLCTQGTKGGYTYSREGNKRVIKWTCSKDGYTENCSASQTWCGDGVKNNNESCDSQDGSHEGWGDGGCSQKCEPIYGPAKCGSQYNGNKKYLDINQSWLTENTPGLCDAGTVTGFHKHTTSPVYTWQCYNYGKVSNQCEADQEWCGDGIIQTGHEQCDPENSGWKNRTDSKGCSSSCEIEYCGDGIVQTYLGEECDGTKGCSSQCKLVNQPTGCNEYFTRSLRLGETKVFIDTGYAGRHDRYLYDKEVTFTENHGDYNNGANPTFKWTDQLVKAGMKLDANSSMQIIESTPYHLITPPSVRSPNNLYVEYTIWYDNVRLDYIPSRDDLYSHKECFKYEISRCGDGVIDTGYNEVCDPGSPETSKAPNGQICNDKCEFEKVLEPVCSSKYNGQTVEKLTESDELCSVGTYTTGSFTFNETTNTWTWKCDNVAGVGTECSATKKITPTGTAKIEKTLEDKIPVEYTGQKLTWKVKVTAKGGNIENFEIRDTMPNELNYLNWGIVNDEGLTITYRKENNPTTTGTDKKKVYHWDVEGTLKENHSITILVYTEVKRMPGSGEDILNIACVIKNDKTLDCDDDNPPVKPLCNSKYNGQTVDNLTAGNHLCETGTYGNFKFDEKRNIWTWTCSNEAGSGVNCSATKKVSSAGEPKIEKTLKNKIIVKKVNQKLTWTVKVTAKGGDITDFKVRDKLPKALKYETYRIVSNEDGLELPSKPSGPVESGSNNIYTWNVTGTLHQGHELVMEIDTIVVKMPTSKDDYLNIACVEDDEIVDCDDAQPGTAEIEKELQDKKEVTHTGQELDWKVTVTAKGGDVENFEIWDKMPVELKYLGWELDKNNTQDKITVTYDEKRSPKASGDVNIHFWNVKGVLYSGNKITMIVKSEVKTMPASGEDILNVACVIQSGNEIDCGQDEPPVPGAKGQPKIEKTLKNKIIVGATGQKLTWTVKVTAKGGDITDFKVRDKLPKALDYETFRVVSNEDGLKLSSKPSGPVESGSNNIYTWDVTGTLHQGHELVMEIDTIVVKMPTKKDDYLNIACVEDDEKVDCDDAKPGTADIEKTLEKKIPVDHTGQNLTWIVKVTAKGGDVENFEIWDKMPKELNYESFEVDKAKTQDKITVTYDKNRSPKASGDVNIHFWNVEGVLYSGKSIVMKVNTTVKEMPATGEDILNIACVIQSGNEIDCGEDKPPVPTAPGLRIKKHFTDGTKSGKVVKIGDEIAYRIDFGNSGNSVASITSIKDFLPKNVKYKSSEIFVNGTKIHTDSTQSGDEKIFKGFTAEDGVHIDIYGGIDLKAGYTGYIILTGEVLKDFTGYTTNFVCIYLNDEVVDCDDATHEIKPSEMSCEKLGVPSGNLPNGGGTKDVKCEASGGVADLITIDCGEGALNNRYITGSNISLLTGICEYKGGAHTYNLKCTVKKDGKDYTSTSCDGSVTVNGTSGPSGCFPAGTKVTMADGTSKNIEDVEVGDVVLSYNTDKNINESNVVLKKFVHKDHVHEMYELTINGEVLKVTDVHPFYVRKSESSKNYAWVEAQDLKVGDILLMIDGSLVKVEKINHYNNQQTVYNLEVEGNHDYFVDKGYLVHNKGCSGPCCGGGCGPTPNPDMYCETDKGKEDILCELAQPHCFNTNQGNFSVESGEYLPYYFNIYRDKEKYNYNYKFANGDESCELGDVDLGSMKCKIVVRDSKNNEVYTKDNITCLKLGETRYAGDSLIEKWADKQNENYNIDINAPRGRYWPTIDYVKTNDKNSGWTPSENLGEYKFYVYLYEYKQCNDSEEWETIEYPEAGPKSAPGCQSNFVLTDSYTVQKTPSGNLTASTNKLDKFKEADGTSAGKPFSSYLDAISTSDYTPNTKVKEAMDAFINKYEKLAVKVETEKFGDKTKVTVKKVPGKDIYFLDGNATFKQSNSTINKPFTIVQTNGSTTINGNLNHNMMLLTRGDIIFKSDCTTDQTVRGIFYAQQSLIRTGVLHNNNLNNNVWCTNGGLNIKGVLIGNNFNSLMKDSRSHLETWFAEGDKTTKVMNGASVVIEYSPSIFTKSTMPPGAEDFTTALSIYKN